MSGSLSENFPPTRHGTVARIVLPVGSGCFIKDSYCFSCDISVGEGTSVVVRASEKRSKIFPYS